MLVLFTAPEGQWAKHSRLVCSQTDPRRQPRPRLHNYLKEANYDKVGSPWTGVPWEGPLVEGDKIEIPVEYYFDPAEHYRETTLKIEALGPRVPKPDAPQAGKLREHAAPLVRRAVGQGRARPGETPLSADRAQGVVPERSLASGRVLRWPRETLALGCSPRGLVRRKGGYLSWKRTSRATSSPATSSLGLSPA